jgi:hypothetical protein
MNDVPRPRSLALELSLRLNMELFQAPMTARLTL